MKTPAINMEIMEYLVWLIEITAAEFFNGDKTAAYEAMKNSGLYQIYTDSYETTHTLGREYLLDEIKQYFTANGVDTMC